MAPRRCRSRRASSGRCWRSCSCTRTAPSRASSSSTPSGARTCRTRRRRWCRSTSRSCARRCRSRGCTHARSGLPARGGRRRARPRPLRALGRRRPRRRSRRATPQTGEGAAGATRSRSGAGPRWPSSRSRSRRHEGARLEELRLAALEWRIEADLALGHHRDVVGELEALIAQHPLREQLRSQHMLALYRSGRHAEALASYQAFRRTLADELGIEPSASLRELERRMLRQDPALELPRAAGARAPRRRQRPRSPARLPGRHRATRAAATSGSPTRSSATGRSTSCSSTAGSAPSSPAGRTRSSPASTGGSRRWAGSSSSTSAARASPTASRRIACPTWRRGWTTSAR